MYYNLCLELLGGLVGLVNLQAIESATDFNEYEQQTVYEQQHSTSYCDLLLCLLFHYLLLGKFDGSVSYVACGIGLRDLVATGGFTQLALFGGGMYFELLVYIPEASTLGFSKAVDPLLFLPLSSVFSLAFSRKPIRLFWDSRTVGIILMGFSFSPEAFSGRTAHPPGCSTFTSDWKLQLQLSRVAPFSFVSMELHLIVEVSSSIFALFGSLHCLATCSLQLQFDLGDTCFSEESTKKHMSFAILSAMKHSLSFERFVITLCRRLVFARRCLFFVTRACYPQDIVIVTFQFYQGLTLQTPLLSSPGLETCIPAWIFIVFTCSGPM
ncbi:hypothetical protein Tco_0770254 [Tanacetum coccineum]|uniref:Uncharacterized protein n=1 Tax=Tanacetum coccineum TaxID=301880 RepID=A0ABQ4ZFC3_9ASTR